MLKTLFPTIEGEVNLVTYISRLFLERRGGVALVISICVVDRNFTVAFEYSCRIGVIHW